MLPRVKELDGDVDKLLAEYQQDIGIEAGQLGEFNQELKDCVDEPRTSIATSAATRVADNVASSSSLSSGVASSMDSSTDSSTDWSVSSRRAKKMCHVSGKSVDG